MNAVLVRAVLGLGANLGDRRATLQSAVDELAATPGVRVVAVSDLVETDPVGGPDQPDYLNAVVVVDTTLSAHELLATCQRIELEHGRERLVRWGARTLDIDVVDYAGTVFADDVLELPHPRAAGRAFVLVPWLSADPSAALPGPDGVPVPVRELIARLPGGDAVAAGSAGGGAGAGVDGDGVRPATVAPLEVPA